MIPSQFEYHSPDSIDHAIELLRQYGDTAKLLAGGHSLLPMMKLRFAEPAHLIDLNRISSLTGISRQNDRLIIGAMTRETDVINSPLVQECCPLLALAATQIADPQVRNRGTIGGDIAHGDPGNDHPAVMLALDADFILQGPDGKRKVAAKDFFKGAYWTELAADELLIAIEIPVFKAATAYGFKKIKRKTGDFATAAATVVMQMEGDVCKSVRIAMTNVGPCAFRALRAEQWLEGKAVDETRLNEVIALVMAASEPVADLKGDREYKAAMAGEMAGRALQQALERMKD